MRKLSIPSYLATIALGLSGCAFSQNVVQSAYDERAEKECRTTSGGNDSIHITANSSCAGGNYEPEPKTKSLSK